MLTKYIFTMSNNQRFDYSSNCKQYPQPEMVQVEAENVIHSNSIRFNCPI